MGRPWAVGDIAHALRTGEHRPEPKAAEKLAMMCEHHESLLTAFGLAKGIRHARKHLSAFAAALPPCRTTAALGQRLVISENPSEIVELLHRLVFVSHQEEHLDADAA